MRALPFATKVRINPSPFPLLPLSYTWVFRLAGRDSARIMPQDNLTELKRRVPGGKYTLARAIAERARQLQSGESIPLVEVKTPNPLSVAIDEIVSGKISFRVDTSASADAPSSVGQDLAAENALDEVLGLNDDVPGQ